MSQLAELYFHDPRLVLVPIEHLSPQRMSSQYAALLRARRGWTADRIDLFNAGFSTYWERATALAERTRTWAPPRLRHVAVVADPLSVRPYAQLLNTSAWTLYDCDFDPERSHPELVAYLLVHGDRMAVMGEVALAAVHNAAYWFARSDAECDAFARAAARSPRPDAVGFRAVADSIGWLRQLAHETLRPPPTPGGHRSIPGTGLLVPLRLEQEPQRLVAQWTSMAQAAVDAFYARWRPADASAVAALCDWLSATSPPLLLTAAGGRVLWDPETPSRLGALRTMLRQASGAAVCDVHADLLVIDNHTREFLSSLATPEALPTAAGEAAQSGYAFMHRTRRLIAYNLQEPGMERLQSPALPYARAMLGARTVHEWAHLAVDAGWVPCRLDPPAWAERLALLADEIERAVAEAPAAVRAQTESDLVDLCRGNAGEPALVGALLARVLITRLPDYQANLLARRFLTTLECETYVRHNIRTLRRDYTPAQRWRMLIRYLAEYQYLRFSAVADPRTFFVRSTWFDTDFFAGGVIGEARFDALAAAVAQLYDAYAVDETKFRFEAKDP